MQALQCAALLGDTSWEVQTSCDPALDNPRRMLFSRVNQRTIQRLNDGTGSVSPLEAYQAANNFWNGLPPGHPVSLVFKG